MSWIQKLYEVYNDCESEIGTGNPPLFPIFHTTVQAHIDAVIDSDGNWCKGRSLVITNKANMTTIIPVTEDSNNRTSAPMPHPLFDKLIYLAGDYIDFGGKIKQEKNIPLTNKLYMENLKEWCDSPFANERILPIYKYLKKRRLVKDLVEDGILPLDENGKVMEKWKGDNTLKPPIFSAVNGVPLDAVVRFTVIEADGTLKNEVPIWLDAKVWNSFIDYENSKDSKIGYCYALGKKLPISGKSPKKIRNAGDSAKLISANDSENFTYRGRFKTPTETYSISKEATEKAHSALRWLIGKQGYHNDSQVILSFGSGGKELPPITANTQDLFGFNDEAEGEQIISTKEKFAENFNKAISGYGCKIESREDVVIIGLDSATPGRLSMFYYKEMPEHELINNIKHWHESTTWQHSFGRIKDGIKSDGAPKYKTISFDGAPSPKDIIEAAYGSTASDGLKKEITKRLLPCISDRARLPIDIMRSAVNRASNPMGKEDWQVQKELSVACSLIKKHYNEKYHKEVVTMALNELEDDRSYLFGRALAYMHKIEKDALNKTGDSNEKNRRTNAQRLMTAYSNRPAKTFQTLRDKILPYLNRGYSSLLESQLQVITDRISVEGMTNTKLSPLYLVGYDSQIRDLYTKKEDKMTEDEKAENN